jgi:CRISPR-associated endoribonuclease Cas6
MGGENQSDLLASVVLIVTLPLAAVRERFQAGRFLQAFFYDTIAMSAPDLADRLHHANGLKPFTVSPPLRWKPPPGHTVSMHTPPAYFIRLTALTREVYQALVEGLLRRFHASPLLPLGRHTIEIQQVLFTQEVSSLAEVASYEALYAGPPARAFRMRFLTPTSFRTGRGNLPFPLPASVYRSLWQKWQLFAPPSLHIDGKILTVVEQHLFPARYTLRTAIAEQKGAVLQVGYVGVCQFELVGEVSQEARRAITALSRFTAYAGIGMKTTMGMGQTLVEAQAPR